MSTHPVTPARWLLAIAACAALSACGQSAAHAPLAPQPVAPRAAETTTPPVTTTLAPFVAAPAGNGDAAFLSAVHTVGIPTADDQSALLGGRGVCNAFDAGETYTGIVASFQRVGHYTSDQASVFVRAAVADFCAEHAGKLGH